MVVTVQINIRICLPKSSTCVIDNSKLFIDPDLDQVTRNKKN